MVRNVQRNAVECGVRTTVFMERAFPHAPLSKYWVSIDRQRVKLESSDRSDHDVCLSRGPHLVEVVGPSGAHKETINVSDSLPSQELWLREMVVPQDHQTRWVVKLTRESNLE